MTRLETALYMEERDHLVVALRYMRALKVLAAAGVPAAGLFPLDYPANAYFTAAGLVCALLQGEHWDPSEGAEEEADRDEPEYGDETFVLRFPASEEAGEDLRQAAAEHLGYSLLDADWKGGHFWLVFYPGYLDEPDLADVARFCLKAREILGKGGSAGGRDAEDQE